MKLVVREAATPVLRAAVNDWQDNGPVVISELTVTEMHRTAPRLDVPIGLISEVVRRLDVVDVSRQALRLARGLPGLHLRSLDAIHIAVALEQGLDTLVTYDLRQGSAASEAGLKVLSP